MVWICWWRQRKRPGDQPARVGNEQCGGMGGFKNDRISVSKGGSMTRWIKATLQVMVESTVALILWAAMMYAFIEWGME